jgi:hypothetical protein
MVEVKMNLKSILASKVNLLVLKEEEEEEVNF